MAKQRDKTIKLFLIEAKRKQLESLMVMKQRVAFLDSIYFAHVFSFGFLAFLLIFLTCCFIHSARTCMWGFLNSE